MDKSCTLTTKEFSKIIKKSHGGLMLKANDISIALSTKAISILNTSTSKYEDVYLFDKATYEQGTFNFQFKENIVCNFFNKKQTSDFLEYSLVDFLTLSSIYSQTLYELILTHADTSFFTIPISNLKKHLNLTDENYKMYKDLRKNILEIVHVQITERTSLRYKFRGIATGVGYSHVEFYDILVEI